MNSLLKKAGLGIALAATAITASAPAEAQRWGGYRHYHRGGDTAGAAILGGIVGLGVGAAIASSNNNRYYDRGYYDRGYYAPPPRAYYYDDYRYNYRPRCWNQWRWDPYYGRDVRVRVCN
ncbi:conserved exported hypothetical protein [Sphingomonas sp. EC-HK361]|uniref:hypothetical protein n=1 Tax=Sphingomonas sp. EC-HK361 TaxID=2038397 RepID=UPI00125BFEA4|nr:hypothetical protein [Sphingomonas sp. EC-HK361]VVS99263.1 conserved exported hypothetical protein [Sphingomonas sp. EC-HK361]